METLDGHSRYTAIYMADYRRQQRNSTSSDISDPERRHRVLIIDEEEDFCELLDYNLTRAGFRVFLAHDREDAEAWLSRELPDLIVLDVMTPGGNGLDYCRRLRAHDEWCSIPIILLTAREGEQYQVQGLTAGADLCFERRVSLSLLTSQIHAVLRNKDHHMSLSDVVEIDDLVIDRRKYTVFRLTGVTSTAIHMPKMQFELLYYLAAHPGHVFSRGELLRKLWKREELIERTVDVHVRKIRVRLGSEYIETVTGIGYRFRAPGKTGRRSS